MYPVAARLGIAGVLVPQQFSLYLFSLHCFSQECFITSTSSQRIFPWNLLSYTSLFLSNGVHFKCCKINSKGVVFFFWAINQEAFKAIQTNSFSVCCKCALDGTLKYMHLKHLQRACPRGYSSRWSRLPTNYPLWIISMIKKKTNFKFEKSVFYIKKLNIHYYNEISTSFLVKIFFTSFKSQ